MFCLDASVIINSQIQTEPHHPYSKRLLEIIEQKDLTLLMPEIVIPEIAAGLARAYVREETILRFLVSLRNISNFIFIAVDSQLSNSAAKMAALHKLKGADSIYLALAEKYILPLVTLDREQKERSPQKIEVLKPAEFLSEY